MWIRSRGQSLWLAPFPASWGAWICCQACPRIQSLRWWNEKQWNTFLFNSQCRIRTTVFFQSLLAWSWISWIPLQLYGRLFCFRANRFISGFYPVCIMMRLLPGFAWNSVGGLVAIPCPRSQFLTSIAQQASQQLRFKAFAAQPRLAIVTKTLALAANDLTHFGIVSWNESCRKMWLVFSVVEPEGKIAKNPRGCFFYFVLTDGLTDNFQLGLPEGFTSTVIFKHFSRSSYQSSLPMLRWEWHFLEEKWNPLHPLIVPASRCWKPCILPDSARCVLC